VFNLIQRQSLRMSKWRNPSGAQDAASNIALLLPFGQYDEADTFNYLSTKDLEENTGTLHNFCL
jgi:hypothetical protein